MIWEHDLMRRALLGAVPSARRGVGRGERAPPTAKRAPPPLTDGVQNGILIPTSSRLLTIPGAISAPWT